jgi:hypothetical protein
LHWTAAALAIALISCHAKPRELSDPDALRAFDSYMESEFHGDLQDVKFGMKDGLYSIVTDKPNVVLPIRFKLKCRKSVDVSRFNDGFRFSKKVATAATIEPNDICKAGQVIAFSGFMTYAPTDKDWVVKEFLPDQR